MGNRLSAKALSVGIAILSMVLSSDGVWAQSREKRVALVVGNSDYANVAKLPFPRQDAQRIGQLLRDAGFDTVDMVLDASNLEFKRAIRKFETEADGAAIAVIYYAGYGLTIGGESYLVPIDAKLASDLDADDESVPLDRLVMSADGASKLRLIILDAGRDSPFTSLMRRNRKNNQGAVSSGLAKTEPTSTNTLIAYAAKAGSVAADGDGSQSPFTAALLKSLTVPGLDVRLAFGRVRDDVMRATASRQEPFVYGSLGSGDISLVPTVPTPKTLDASDADIKSDYELVSKIGTRRAWEVFLSSHKTGFYADLARIQIARLNEAKPDVGSGAASGGTIIAAVQPPPGVQDSSTQEALEWSRIKDSSDPTVFEQFVRKYPASPLATTAQRVLDVLKDARRQSEAEQKATETVRAQAERKKSAEAAARQEAQRAEAERTAMEAAARAAEARAREAASQPSQDLPDFPWPPPIPSSYYVLPDPLLKDRNTVGEVADTIVSALERTGYVQRTFFRTKPGGVALVTQLERIEEDGTPARPERWSRLDKSHDSVRDIATFLQGLFFVQKGHYRLIVFILQKDAFIPSGKQMEEDKARKLIMEGTNVLPPQAALQSYVGNHCTVMIYEFASEGKAAHFINNSALTAREHLSKAGVLAVLGN